MSRLHSLVKQDSCLGGETDTFPKFGAEEILNSSLGFFFFFSSLGFLTNSPPTLGLGIKQITHQHMYIHSSVLRIRRDGENKERSRPQSLGTDEEWEVRRWYGCGHVGILCGILYFDWCG